MAYVPLIALLAKATVVSVNSNLGKRIKASYNEEIEINEECHNSRCSRQRKASQRSFAPVGNSL